MDDQGSAQSVIHWTPLVRKNSTDFTFTDYVDQFLYTIIFLLHSDLEPKIGADVQKKLHRSDQVKTGD